MTKRCWRQQTNVSQTRVWIAIAQAVLAHSLTPRHRSRPRSDLLRPFSAGAKRRTRSAHWRPREPGDQVRVCRCWHSGSSHRGRSRRRRSSAVGELERRWRVFAPGARGAPWTSRPGRNGFGWRHGPPCAESATDTDYPCAICHSSACPPIRNCPGGLRPKWQAFREALSALAVGDGQVIEVASIAVGAAPRRDGAMDQPPGSLRFAQSRRGGAPTVGLPVEPTPNADLAFRNRRTPACHRRFPPVALARRVDPCSACRRLRWGAVPPVAPGATLRFPLPRRQCD